MQIDPAVAIQILVNLAGLAAIYTGLKVRIEVVATKVDYLERSLTRASEKPSSN